MITIHHTLQFVSEGYTILKANLLKDLDLLQLSIYYNELTLEQKLQYSFPNYTYGYIPQGMEKSINTEQKDLCERFCYRELPPHYQQFNLESSSFFKTLKQYYSTLRTVRSSMLRNLLLYYGTNINTDVYNMEKFSYLQYCAYLDKYKDSSRDNLQDLHEDGNLFTIDSKTL